MRCIEEVVKGCGAKVRIFPRFSQYLSCGGNRCGKKKQVVCSSALFPTLARNKQDMPSSVSARQPRSGSSASLARLIRDLRTPWKMRWYFLRRLPSCWFWGVRVQQCSPAQAAVSIPFSWRTQNPFRSTYFAALSGAAELSTGLLALLAIHDRGPFSMLITKVEVEFVKKADTLTVFICEEGAAIELAVQQALDTGQGAQARVLTTGRNTAGEIVCQAWFTWSFKQKRQA
jgi:hypothetical protein